MFNMSPSVCRIYIFPPPAVSVQSRLKILTLCAVLGSCCLHESNPCCLFICSYLFLVTEARNGCVVGLGVSTDAGGYFYPALLQAALHKHLLNSALDEEKKKSLHKQEDDKIATCMGQGFVCPILQAPSEDFTAVEENKPPEAL